MVKLVLDITNCMDCPNHAVIPDPDPDDSFNMDDLAVVCKVTENPVLNKNSRYRADHQDRRCVTISCRPYNLRKESTVPKWCPLQKEQAA